MELSQFLAEYDALYNERQLERARAIEKAQEEVRALRLAVINERILPHIPEVLHPYINIDIAGFDACLEVPGRSAIGITVKHDGIDFYTNSGLSTDLVNALAAAKKVFEQDQNCRVEEEHLQEVLEPYSLLQRIAIALEKNSASIKRQSPIVGQRLAKPGTESKPEVILYATCCSSTKSAYCSPCQL